MRDILSKWFGLLPWVYRSLSVLCYYTAQHVYQQFWLLANITLVFSIRDGRPSGEPHPGQLQLLRPVCLAATQGVHPQQGSLLANSTACATAPGLMVIRTSALFHVHSVIRCALAQTQNVVEFSHAAPPHVLIIPCWTLDACC